MLRATYQTRGPIPQDVIEAVIIFKDITVRGFWLAKWYRTASPERQKELFGTITGLIAAGKLSAPIHATYKVKDIKEAVAVAAGGERNGKVVIVSDEAKT